MNLPLLALISVATSSTIWSIFLFSPVSAKLVIQLLFVSPFVINLVGLLMVYRINRRSMTARRWLGAIAFCIVAPLITFYFVGIVQLSITDKSLP